MSARRWFSRLILALALLAPPLATPPVASATVMVPVPLEDMVRDATAIVHARVVRTGSRLVRDGDRTMPHTMTELEVIEWLSGSTGVTRIQIDELGGTYPGGGVAIDGTPTYRVGDEVVVFLRSTSMGFRTLAMVQGQFVVRHGVPGTPDVVVRDTTDIGLATWEGGPMSVIEGGREQMELQPFLAWIRGAVAQTIPGGGGTTSRDATGGGR